MSFVIEDKEVLNLFDKTILSTILAHLVDNEHRMDPNTAFTVLHRTTERNTTGQ